MTAEDVLSIFQNPLYTAILGAVGGVVATLITELGKGWITEVYENRKDNRKRKREAAKDIISYVNEGEHSDFNRKAGSIRHIKLRALEIEAIDKNVGAKLRNFLDCWSEFRAFMKYGSTPNTADISTAMDLKYQAEELGKELLEIARRWSK